jgi:FkbM family methyltransferase
MRSPAALVLRRLRGTTRNQAFFERMLKFALRGLNIGAETESEKNGERRAAELVRSLLVPGEGPFVVFDVGANRGAFTDMVLRVFAGVEVSVHLFEPARALAEGLRRFASDSRLVVNAAALSDSTGQGVLHTSPVNSALGSLYARQLDPKIALSGQETVDLDTLDHYCAAHAVRHVHFLKLDVEGHEVSVLKGASNLLSSDRVAAIQFEFGGANVDSRTFFRDFWNLLAPRFRLYRILKDGLCGIPSYHNLLEQFTYANYLALSQEAAEKYAESSRR